MREQKTQAVILGTTNVFDADRFYLLFTREFGKVRARARGVRRPSSRLGGHLLSFFPTELQLVANGEFYLIVQAHMGAGNAYPEDAISYQRYAEQMAEALDKLVLDHEPHVAVYDALVYTLERLRESTHPELLVAEFMIKSLASLGYSPELEQSVVGDLPLDPDHLAWNSQLGGIYTIPPEGMTLGSQRITSSKSIIVMRQLLRPRFVCERLMMDDDVRHEVIALIHDYIQTVIG